MKKLFLLLFSVFLGITSFAQADSEPKGTDANIVGHVVGDGEHIPGASVIIKGTSVGTATDATGHYQIIDLKPGTYIAIAKALGFKPKAEKFSVTAGQTKEIKFELEQDALGLEEVVVTADRNEKSRREASVIVNTISPKLFSTAQSTTMAESLNFCSGLRTENNCQNCGFNQVRVNGLEGPYSQILVNSRPIFSGLAGVYGLELIPSSMIERIEVIRGGGSALYGSNAIAGTINMILKDPIQNTYEIGATSSVTGVGLDEGDGIAYDNTVNFNASVVTPNKKTGLAVYGFFRDKDPYDANNDGFSELVKIKNSTIGARAFHRLGNRSKVTLDFFNIKEDRRGGNKFDSKQHEADVAEWVAHNLTTGAATYEQFFRENDKFSVYVSGQKVGRDSYYGAGQSLKDYGRTDDFTYTIGTQYAAAFASSNLTIGIENRNGKLEDKKLGYLDFENPVDGEVLHTEDKIIANQTSNTLGFFAQYDMKFGQFALALGARFENYKINDKQHQAGDVAGSVFSPRVTFKYDAADYLQFRASYAQGYRAPQIFDEDLHIETSEARKVLHENAEDLQQETSHSFMLSADFNKYIGSTALGILVEGFHTSLNDAFVNEVGAPLEDGTVIYTRTNAEDGATVSGANIEINFIPKSDLTFKAGFTVQQSSYVSDDQGYGEKKFFRTPNTYGFLALDWDFVKNICFSMSGTYTGPMVVPYHGVLLEEGEARDNGELHDTDPFFDLGAKISYDIKLKNSTLQILGGVKNIFNSYQNDFDSTADRDPAYVYGPGLPRTVYFGLKFGNVF